MTKLIHATFEIEAAEVIAHLFKHWQVNAARTWESSAWKRVQSAGEGHERALSVFLGYGDEATMRMVSELLADGLGVVHCRGCDERHAARELRQEEWFSSGNQDYVKGIDWYCRSDRCVLHITTESSTAW